MTDREIEELKMLITDGEIELLEKLSIFNDCDLLTKNMQMLARKNRYGSTRPNSADCLLEELQTDDKENQEFCNGHASLANTEASNMKWCSLIKKSPSLTGLEPRSIVMKMIETIKEELVAMEADSMSSKVICHFYICYFFKFTTKVSIMK